MNLYTAKPSTYYRDLLQSTWPAPPPERETLDILPSAPIRAEGHTRPRSPATAYCLERSLPPRFEYPELMGGYRLKPVRAGYVTSSSQYGQRPLTALETPDCYHKRHWKFWDDLYKCGMYRNSAPNTRIDKAMWK